MKSKTHVIQACHRHGIYYDNLGRYATTANKLARSDSQIDENAVFSVLQFGAIVPPLSPWKGIHRLPPGYQFKGTDMIGPIDLKENHIKFTNNIEQQADQIEAILDEIIQKSIEIQNDNKPILLFSGGVDSGIIASRLASLGYTESRLINFSFGADDQESQLAEKLAYKLGLAFERVTAVRKPCRCLDDPGRFFDHPFGDHATQPTLDLAHAILNHLTHEKNRLIIDGIGADGGFGMTSKIEIWNRIDRTPSFVKKAASYIYKKALWKHKFKYEYFIGLLRRSEEMPILSSIFAQNSLGGIFYNNEPQNLIYSLLEKWVQGWAGDFLALQSVGVNISLKEANIFSHKALHIFECAGHHVLSPFLEPKLVAAGFAYIPYWQKGEPKALIKKSLSRHIPHKMIYRPKSAFSDPYDRLFYSNDFLDYLRSTVEPSGPLSHLLVRSPILQSCDKLARGHRLPGQTLNLLWAMTFTDRWYRTAEREGESN